MAKNKNPKMSNAADEDYKFDKYLRGIQGFDEITFGGLTKGRSILVTSIAGFREDYIAMQFIVNGAIKYNELGLYVAS